MTKKLDEMTCDEHKQLGIDLFNHAWELMEKPNRSSEEDTELLNTAHASYYHWIASKPPVVNLARGEWLVSRVYCVLNRSEPALYHAKRSLGYCVDNGIGDFDLAFGYEAVARALSLTSDPDCGKYLELAHKAASDVKESEDREIVLQDLETIKCQ
jgi:hypothetical protein